MMKKVDAKIILTAGGTGGHVLPGLAFARALMEKGYKVSLISDARGIRHLDIPQDLETRLLPLKFYHKRGVFFKGLGIAELMIQAVLMFFYLLKQKPSYVVGFGGFPSFPLLAAAWVLCIPYALHEQNAVFGRVNSLFRRGAKRVYTSFPEMPGIYVGNPIRPEFENSFPKKGTSKTLTLLIMGGSQGAHIFANIIPKALELLPKKIHSKLVIYQQARPGDQEALVQKYTHLQATVETFFQNVPELMHKADLIISRAGAGTVAEIMAMNKKALLLPYPFAMDNHQEMNARAFVDMGYGWMVLDKDFSPEFLAQFLQEFIQNPPSLPQTQPIRADLNKMINELNMN